MNRFLVTFSFLLVAACNSCLPTPAPVPVPVSAAGAGGEGGEAGAPSVAGSASLGGASPAAAMCANLEALKCYEADSLSACVEITQHAIDSRLRVIPIACLTKATTKAVARACGFVECPD